MTEGSRTSQVLFVDLPIYFDHHATTPLDPRVLEAMLPFLHGISGNAASRQHLFGRRANRAVEEARTQVAGLVGAGPSEIVFTSGATESDNLAIKGAARARRAHGRDHLVISAIEHPAVLESARRLEREGFRVTQVSPGKDGLVSPASVAEVLSDRTALVSVMLANNEVGSIQPLSEIARLTHERGVILHTDAAQALGWVPLDVRTTAVDLVSISGHKMYGPKGIGALYVRRRNPRVELCPELDGGGQEGGRRSGTLNVPTIVGFGVACEIARSALEQESHRVGALRDRFWDELTDRIEGTIIHGPQRGDSRLPHNLNVCFDGVSGSALMTNLAPYLALSSGAACASALGDASHVLRAMGVDERRAQDSLRIGLGRSTTREEIDYAVERLADAIQALRALPK